MEEEEECMVLPPGFRFHPTDEEIVTHYLSPKVFNPTFTARAMGDVDLNKCEPWDLPSKAKMGEKEWYFFCHKDRKYPTGMRTNRATEAGYWKATGKDKEIFRGRGVLVGMKKTLVFYRGRAPKGEKTNWVMHEYRLEGKIPLHNLPKSTKDEWVVCRVFHKSIGMKKNPMGTLTRMDYSGDELSDSPTLPPLVDPSYNPISRRNSIYIDESFDYKGIATAAGSPLSPCYFSTMAGMEEEPQQHNLLSIQLSSSCNPEFTPPLGGYFEPPGPRNFGYLHRGQANLVVASDASSSQRRQCKMEQLSNQSMISQDTDRNTEISSVVYDDLDDPSTAGAVMDLENMWRY